MDVLVEQVEQLGIEVLRFLAFHASHRITSGATTKVLFPGAARTIIMPAPGLRVPVRSEAMTRKARGTSLALLAALAAAVALSAPPTGAQTPPELRGEGAPRVDAKADEAVKKMSAFLAGIRQFEVEAEETFDAEYARAYRVQLANVRTLTVDRPSRFAARAEGDTLHRASWFDGRALTVLNRKRNVYASLDMPGTIDVVLDRLAADHQVFLPLSDLLYADPYTTLMDGVLYGKYLGLHQAAGTACHHLTFGQDGLEWQIWIDAGAQPLPRKLAIAYWELPGVPQYEAVFRRWNLSPKITDAQFRFEAPAGARRIGPEEIAELR
jgi:hypothetical protein